MTNQAALMGHALAWGEDNLDCRVCVPATKTGGSGAPERTAEMRALLGVGLQGAGMREWGSALVALPHASLGAGFRDLDLPRHANPHRIVDGVEWREAVASHVQAALQGAVPAVEVGAALRKRIRSSDEHKRFVDAVLLACRSPRAEGLGITRYRFDEDSVKCRYYPSGRRGRSDNRVVLGRDGKQLGVNSCTNCELYPGRGKIRAIQLHLR